MSATADRPCYNTGKVKGDLTTLYRENQRHGNEEVSIMNYDFEQYKFCLTDYVNSITERSRKGGKKAFVCPLCESGTGRNHTGAFFIYDNGASWKCFSCNKSGDIYDLYQEINHCDRAEAYKAIDSLYGFGEALTMKAYRPLDEFQPLKEEELPTDYLEKIHRDIEEAPKHLDELLRGAGSYRGISKETLVKYGVGYLPNWKTYNNEKEGKGYPSARLIIPTSKDSYLARATDPNAKKEFKAIKQGRVHLFPPLENDSEPAFIVEGEIDALSIIDNGGQAVALGSTSNVNRLYEAIDRIEDFNKPFILALDSDEAGQQAQEEMKQELKARGIFYITHYWQGGKDANEILTAIGTEAFNDEIKEAVELAREQALQARPICFITENFDTAEAIKNKGFRAVTIDQAEGIQAQAVCVLIRYGHQPPDFLDIDITIPCKHEIYSGDYPTKEELAKLEQHLLKPEQIKQADTEEFIFNHSGASILAMLQNDRQKPKKPISTGIKELDEKLDGGIYDGLYVITGTTGSGKSNLAIQIADAMAENGQQEADGTITKRDILYFSLEMPKQEILARTIARLANVIKGTTTCVKGADYRQQAIHTREILDGLHETWKGIKGQYNESIYNTAISSYENNIQDNIYYYDSTDNKDGNGNYKGAFTTEDIINIAKRHEAVTGQPPIIFIDYLQLLESNINKDERGKMKEATLALKEYCIGRETAVIAISSVARSNYNREADIDSGKEAGEIEYTANVVIGLSLAVISDFDNTEKNNEKTQRRKDAEKENPRKVKLSILKNRYGNTADMLFDFYAEVNRWEYVSNWGSDSLNSYREIEEQERKEKKRKAFLKKHQTFTNSDIEWNEDIKEWREKEATITDPKIQVRCSTKPTKTQIKNYIAKYHIPIDPADPEQMDCIVWRNKILTYDPVKLEEVKKKQEAMRQSQLGIE